jgi:N-acetylglucosaminyldiphosphoundecaprenol N-acetyl-beta-D-mannosaminyltransferase
MFTTVKTPARVEVLGVPVDCVDLKGALAVVDAAISSNESKVILAVNPEKVMAARKNSAILSSLRKAGLLIPDGIGVVMAVRLLTGEKIERVPGAELMPAICNRAVEKGYKVFLYGASSEVNAGAVHALRERYSDLRIVGHQHGYLDESEMPAFIDRINASQADVLFVALGSPRQELWMERYLPQLDVKVFQGVGGTFDVLAGSVRRAPKIFRRMHLEWFYRLITEPQRISRQIVYPVFAVQIIWQKIVRRGRG